MKMVTWIYLLLNFVLPQILESKLLVGDKKYYEEIVEMYTSTHFPGLKYPLGNEKYPCHGQQIWTIGIFPSK